MGKFQEAGQEAEALAAQLAMNSAQMAAAQNEPDYGSDDDGGADTPADAQSQFLTSANSNELEINQGGSRGQPQLKETILKPLVADTISNLLIANGYSAESARMIESAAKDSPAHIQTLPPQATALALGALDLTGEYRIKQIAIFENGEYVITIAAKDDGGYEQAAEPIIPADLLDDFLRNQIAATHFTIADGVYSAGIRSGMPEPVIREIDPAHQPPRRPALAAAGRPNVARSVRARVPGQGQSGRQGRLRRLARKLDRRRLLFVRGERRRLSLL